MADNIIPYGYSMDITNYGKAASSVTDDTYVSWRDADSTKDKTSLDFNDMLLLMVTQFQNQTIDNQADTSDMMNQLIQMTVMQAITSMSTQVDELTTANVMGYAASLVDKWVTLGVYDENGIVTEKYGIVEATGTYNGMPVIFVDGQSYFLSSIMGVGKLPPLDGGSDSTDSTDSDSTDSTEGAGSTEGTGGTEGTGSNGETTSTQTYKCADGTTVTITEIKDTDGTVLGHKITIVPDSSDQDALQTVIETNGDVTVDEENNIVTIDVTGLSALSGDNRYAEVDGLRYEDQEITVSSSGVVTGTPNT